MKSSSEEMVEEMSEKKEREILEKLKIIYSAAITQQKNQD